MVSSYYLPDMTGADLIQELKGDTETASISFVLISSETRFDYLDPIRQAGAAAILPKPFSKEELQTALTSTLALNDAHQLEFDTIDIESLEVLLVDDSGMARRHIKRVLSTLGLRHFAEAETGRQALELIANQHFDLLVTDYNMPEMDGYELTKRVREDSCQSSIPILMVTSEENENRLLAVQKAGVSAICDKPFEFDTVQSLIASVLIAD